ncbi:MAG: DUF4239 domain-containing protein [Myxococcota bacterium]
MGRSRHAADPDAARAGAAVVDGAVFGLMGLLIAFAFSGAMQRWDARRSLVVAETNDIGTAWLRLDLLPADAQPALRDLFRRYVDARLAVYQSFPDLDGVRAQLALANGLQGEIWSQAVAGCLAPDGERARMLLLPALNEMIDITTDRTVALVTHPPVAIYGLLLAIALASSLLAGYAMAPSATRNWLHLLCFSAAMAVGVFVIVDLEFPRAGLIRIDSVDQILIDLRATMK